MMTLVDGNHAMPANSGQPNYDPHKLEACSLRGIKGLGISQIVMGILCILFEIAMMALYYSDLGLTNTVNGRIAPGIWNGALILITGLIGVVTAMKNRRGWIIAYMVINIIGAVEMLIFVTITGVATTQSRLCAAYFYFLDAECPMYAPLVLNILNLVMAISQFIITIVAASLCCGPACCNSTGRPIQTTTMVIHSGQQQMSTTTVVGSQPYGQLTYTQAAQPQPYIQTMHPGMAPGYGMQHPPAYPGQQQQQTPPTYYEMPQQPVTNGQHQPQEAHHQKL